MLHPAQQMLDFLSTGARVTVFKGRLSNERAFRRGKPVAGFFQLFEDIQAALEGRGNSQEPLGLVGLEATSPRQGTKEGFGTAICTSATCPDDAGTALPRNGSAWAWFGGTANAETSTLSQSVVIPSGSARHLNFFLRRGFTSAPLDAVLRVKVDGAIVRSFDEPASAEGGYVARSVDLGAFANGASHVVQF